MQLYIGQWEWFTDPNTGATFWRAPGGNAVGMLDLRSLPQQRTAGGTGGLGVFGYATSQSNPLLVASLGDSFTTQMSALARSALQSEAGFSSNRGRFPALIQDLFLAGDPTGATRWKPLLRGRRDKIHILFGGQPILTERVDSSHGIFSTTIDVFRADYRRDRGSLSVETRQRIVGKKMLDLYRRMDDETADLILPPEFQGDGWAVPRTVISESFNTADGDTLGPNLSWTETGGDIDISGNAAVRIAEAGPVDNNARAETDLSSADHYAKTSGCQYHSGSGYVGLTCRHRASGTAAQQRTFYVVDLRNDNPPVETGGSWINKRVDDVRTELSRNLVGSIPNADRALELRVNSSQLYAFLDGALKDSLTDTSITGFVRAGISMNTLGSGGDLAMNDFEAGDLGADIIPTTPA